MELLTIGELARRSEVHRATIRTYDRMGIINATRDSSGRRMFTDADVDVVRAAYRERMTRWPHLSGRRPMAA